tara:strand:+ start:608 stop:1411 length:804 start_codon:yes stop_codon:yes gene_type:complete
MHAILHPPPALSSSKKTLPAVRYAGRCPQTGCERALRPTHEALSAAEELMDYLSTHRTKSDDFSTASLYEEANGKMFGVMVCRRQNGQRGVLHAFSGEWEGRKTPPGWVPSSGFLSEYEAERDRTEAEVDNFTQRIAELKEELPGTRALRRQIEELKIERGALSRALTERIHDAYRFENALGEVLPLRDVDTGGVRPPTGMGDCCAPKLVQYAIRQGLEPLSMIEFWWGASSRAHPRIEGHYYSACRSKCYPIMGFLLRGIDAAEVC